MDEPPFLPAWTAVSAALAYVGMTCILAAFVLETRGKLDSRGAAYLWLMAVGSLLLAVRAAHAREWAFLILEAVWCAAAFLAMARPGERTHEA
jgi:hypothetical protein